MQKIGHFEKKNQPLLILSEHFLLGTSITNFKGIHEQLFKLSSPQGQIIDYTVKNHNKSAFLIFFQPLLNLSENCFLVTCITHPSYRAHKVKLLR